MPDVFAERIALLRERRGLTRAALAHLIGVSRPTLWAWETGKGQPRAENFAALADALAVSAEFLRFGAALANEPGRPPLSKDQTLQAYIAEAKQEIAGLAGVDAAKVTILIEY